MSETRTEAGEGSLGTLPRWDLRDLYPGPDAPEVKADARRLAAAAKDFHQRFAGRLAALDGAALGAAVVEYEALQEGTAKLASYAQLLYAGDMSDPRTGRFYQWAQETTTALSSDLLFFTLELNRLEEADLAEKLRDPTLARYRPWIAETRAFRPHQLEDSLERLLHEKQVTGRAAWTRLFDETMAALRFPFDGKELSSAEILHRMTDRDGAVRRRAAESFGKLLRANERTFALITNTLAKDKAMEDEWRCFARPVSSRNLANLVEDEVVEALVSAVAESYPRLSHRYYALKARWLGVEKLNHWDRNAPVPESDERTLPWEEARERVLSAYRDFSPELAAQGRRFFERPWIDAPVSPGKAPGAFAHPTVPSAHPFLLLNYQGRVRDVMTLAHELGHGVHQLLAAGQGQLLASTPLTLAETASVFGEMLTFQAMLRETRDPARRKAMLASKVEDMLNTVVRQVAFHRFETRLHDRRREAELLPEEIGALWLETQREALGPAFALEEDYAVYWAYIPHFIHVPFYVYAYAFGDCLVNSLYAVYRRSEEGFAEKYLEMLRAGGSKRHRELLAPFGLDASDPGFWRRGLSVIAAMIDELEGLG